MWIKNFLFHRVSSETDYLWRPMKQATFEKIIDRLCHSHYMVTLESFLANPDEHSARAGRKQVATILFDDGYRDNYEVAVPLLEKYNCPASFYVVTNCIDTGIPTWTYQLDYILQQSPPVTVLLTGDDVPETLRTFSLPFNKHNPGCLNSLKPWLKTIPDARREAVLNLIRSQCGNLQLPQDKMMNWDQVRSLVKKGFHVGSHTHTHPLLAVGLTDEEIIHELSHSANRLQTETGIKPVTISYPNGSHNQRVMQLAAQTGYKWGLAVEEKLYKYSADSVYAIPRIQLFEEAWWKTAYRMSSLHHKLKRLWQ